jgi:phenylpyruvate tautomerase PptA (4-oxalocrotonate tautomerase family)
MPFIEILGPELAPVPRRAAARGMTQGLTEAFGIAAEIVTIYFQPVLAGHYVHAGTPLAGEAMRVFIKVHAFPREVAKKRRAAAAMTQAYAQATGVDAKSIAIYFLERAAEDVAHGGELACD